MTNNKEIEVPKELREFMLDSAEETTLGQRNGAKKQYRYGKLHIREYDDKFLVHMDKFDPRVEPIKHLVFDAPEVLIGLASGVLGGSHVAKKIAQSYSKRYGVVSGLTSSFLLGYFGYYLTKKLKER